PRRSSDLSAKATRTPAPRAPASSPASRSSSRAAASEATAPLKVSNRYPHSVIPALVAGIHLTTDSALTDSWIPGTRPGMTVVFCPGRHKRDHRPQRVMLYNGLTSFHPVGHPMTLSEREAQITAWLAEQKDAMIALLREVVNIDSGTYDKAGVDAVGARFEQFFAEHGLPTRREPNERFGDAIHIRLDDRLTNEKPVLLLGHRDTVFSKGEAERRPFRIEGDRAYGPGVADMKAGLVMNAFVLAAFRKFGAPVPVVGLITSDEEIGSPACRPIIERAAKEARAVLNSEPGRPTGNVVTGRKGGVFMRMTIEGRPAHSGGNFEKGISAIGELAHKIIAIHKLTDLAKGTTLNVGIMRGGEAVNMV